MDSFFNNDSADIVQLISLPLEIVGFFLAFIEVKNEGISIRLEELIDKLGNYAKENMLVLPFYSPKPDHRSIHYYFSRFHLFIFLIVLGTALLLGYLIITGYFTSWPGLNAVGTIALFFLTIVAFRLLRELMMLSLHIASSVVEFLNEFSGGKAVGTIGFFIAMLGLLGEAYQVTTMYVA